MLSSIRKTDARNGVGRRGRGCGLTTSAKSAQQYAGSVPVVSVAGNIRELQNIVERSVSLRGDTFGRKGLLQACKSHPGQELAGSVAGPLLRIARTR